MDCSNLQNVCGKYLMAIHSKELFESLSNHIIIDFIKENNVYTNCSVCYLYLISHYIYFSPFVSNFFLISLLSDRLTCIMAIKQLLLLTYFFVALDGPSRADIL